MPLLDLRVAIDSCHRRGVGEPEGAQGQLVDVQGGLPLVPQVACGNGGIHKIWHRVAF
jgi:hypothetical protein